jgi:hypothetical protein
LKVIFAWTNPNILLTHYFQYKRIKKKWTKNTHTWNAKFFVETLQPLTFQLQWNSNLQNKCKGRGSTNHRGANNTMSISNNMMNINYNTMNINGSTWKNKWTQWKPTTTWSTLATTWWTPTTIEWTLTIVLVFQLFIDKQDENHQ